ncbi:MAG TPA: DNA methyltransferase, partial [Thermoanaerobaculia bacterium]|nr:DNA methyltransferase [Thermoanaerobaculia bacterium]
WSGTAGGAERANYQMYLSELVALLDLPKPDPATHETERNDYVFERFVRKSDAGEPAGTGRIDLYKRGCFVLEAKQSRWKGGAKHRQALDQAMLPEIGDKVQQAPAKYDVLMRDARRQAEDYARALPHEWPPFIIVCDVGRAFELYFDWSGMGKDYGFFPDKQHYRIELEQLRDPDVQARLRAIWTNPKSVDPRLQAAEVTRGIARRLAQVSAYLEASNRSRARETGLESMMIEETSLFLMRIIFCMFAEDIGLLPKDRFKAFLEDTVDKEKRFEEGLHDLWAKMNTKGGGFAWAVDEAVRWFNGGLFESNRTYVLSNADRGELFEAAKTNWRRVEPAIFGTLLEQALTAEERAKLGAHYTPRPYVERLVDATIMEVLKAEWAEAQTRIEAALPDEGAARAIAEGFHGHLAGTRVLDPACGTGNFLYVSMELMQRLESEVIDAIQKLGGEAHPKVGPNQFFGLEKNPRAAKIAELVLWIGWLRFRIRNNPEDVPEPVLDRSARINFGRHGGYDAVLRQNEIGEPDLANPLAPDWPEAEFTVGNPPFIGKGSAMREALGDAYVEALWKAHPNVPRSADFVMFWWDRAATILASGKSPLRRFGLVTTNSITGSFNRRVIARHAGDLSLVFAVPDHPWIKAPKAERKERARRRGKERLQLLHPELGFVDDESDVKKRKSGPAAVRVAMTVAEAGHKEGRLVRVSGERGLDTEDPQIETIEAEGWINSDLSLGADITGAADLKANQGLSCNGMMLAGQGFKINRVQARHLVEEDGEAAHRVIRPYVGGSELVQHRKDSFVVDLCGLTESEARQQFPETYSHLLKTVKPERDKNRRPAFRKRWWVFGEPRKTFRPSLEGLARYIATTETTKHRIFQFLPTEVVPDHMIIAIASDDAFHLGVLSSRIHVEWALKAGGWLGVGNDSRYSKSKVFDPFPFPDPDPKQRTRIAELAEELDATRKAALVETLGLTMTEIYNLRAKVALGAIMSPTEQERAAKARAAIINRLHEQLDEAVADAYGWPSNLAPAEIVAGLVALNAERVAEEERGTIHWLRPDHQVPRFGPKQGQE